jgi:hypothetical protein
MTSKLAGNVETDALILWSTPMSPPLFLVLVVIGTVAYMAGSYFLGLKVVSSNARLVSTFTTIKSVSETVFWASFAARIVLVLASGPYVAVFATSALAFASGVVMCFSSPFLRGLTTQLNNLD